MSPFALPLPVISPVFTWAHKLECPVPQVSTSPAAMSQWSCKIQLSIPSIPSTASSLRRQKHWFAGSESWLYPLSLYLANLPPLSPFVCQTNSQAEPGESCTFSPSLGFPLLHHTGLHHSLYWKLDCTTWGQEGHLMYLCPPCLMHYMAHKVGAR